MKGYISRIGMLLTVLLAITAYTVTGCSGGGNVETSTDVTWPAMDALGSINTEDITSIELTRSTEAGAERHVITDATQIEDVYLRLKDVSVKGESDMGVDDDGLVVKLETADKTLGFSFEGDILVLEDGSRYEVENLSSLKRYADSLTSGEAGAGGAQTAEAEPASGSGTVNTNTGSTGNSGTNSSGSSAPAPSGGSSNADPYTGASDYDVSKGFEKTDYNGIDVLYFNDFLMTMPGNDKYSFEMNGNEVTFYLFSAQQEGYGGKLVTIKAYDLDDNSYEQLPSYHVAGVGGNVNKRFIAIYPTDVQWNGADSTQDADYRDLKDYLWKIGEGAVNSPLQTSDSSPAP